MEKYDKTPEEEERMIDEAFAEVLDGYMKSNHRKKTEIIERAFKFAKKPTAVCAVGQASHISSIP